MSLSNTDTTFEVHVSRLCHGVRTILWHLDLGLKLLNCALVACCSTAIEDKLLIQRCVAKIKPLRPVQLDLRAARQYQTIALKEYQQYLLFRRASSSGSVDRGIFLACPCACPGACFLAPFFLPSFFLAPGDIH